MKEKRIVFGILIINLMLSSVLVNCGKEDDDPNHFTDYIWEADRGFSRKFYLEFTNDGQWFATEPFNTENTHYCSGTYTRNGNAALLTVTEKGKSELDVGGNISAHYNNEVVRITPALDSFLKDNFIPRVQELQ
jgi:hypothetical protein